MSSVVQAFASQLANIEKRAGKPLKDLCTVVKASKLSGHGELRDLLKSKLGLGHGDANTLVHYARQTGPFAADRAETTSASDVMDGIYVNAKAALRPLHERLLAQIAKFGPFETAPKKGYVSLRRKKQFAMIGPATNTSMEVGLNVSDLPASPRLKEMPEKSMCRYKLRFSKLEEIDAELLSWIKKAFQSAG
jgi:hypothetical protein